MIPRRLLAIDLDGTLLRADGTIDPRDTAAIARARRGGVAITLATGRLGSAAAPIARSLDLDLPMVCADGAALVCPRTGRVERLAGIGAPAIDLLLAACAAHAVVPFVGFADTMMCGAAGLALRAFVAGWSAALDVGRHRADRDEALMVLGLGSEPGVAAALNKAAPLDIDLATFPLGPGAPWALRAQPRGAGKATALARLAASMDIAPSRVAAVGDWHNDVTMLRWAGRSFAMGESPPAVRAAAGEVLDATAGQGGGVAEVVSRWLGV